MTTVSFGARASVTSQQLSLSVKRRPRSPYRCSRYGYLSHATLAYQAFNLIRPQPRPGSEDSNGRRNQVFGLFVEKLTTILRVLRQKPFDLSTKLGIGTSENADAALSSGVVQFFDLLPALGDHAIARSHRNDIATSSVLQLKHSANYRPDDRIGPRNFLRAH